MSNFREPKICYLISLPFPLSQVCSAPCYIVYTFPLQQQFCVALIVCALAAGALATDIYGRSRGVFGNEGLAGLGAGPYGELLTIVDAKVIVLL